MHWMLLIVYLFPLGTISVPVTGNNDETSAFCDEARKMVQPGPLLTADRHKDGADYIEFSGAGGKPPDAYLCIPRPTDGTDIIYWRKNLPIRMQR